MLFTKRAKNAQQNTQKNAQPQPKEDMQNLPYYAQVIAQLNALDVRKKECNKYSNPERIKSMVILDHEQSQIIREALDNGIIPTYSDAKKGWEIFSSGEDQGRP